MRRVLVGIVVVSAALTVALPAVSASALSAGSIVCTINVQNPHGSTHVDGTINVVSTVSCTATVARLSQQTALYKVPGTAWWGTTKVNYDSKTIQSNSATTCSHGPGSFYGVAVTDVTWPVGYVGPTHDVHDGNTVSVTCSAAGVTLSAPQGADVTSSPSGFSYTLTATHP